MKQGKLIDEIDKFSNKKLKRKNDLNILIEIGTSNDNIKLIEDLSFTAKYVLGLQRVLKKEGLNPEINNLDKVKRDFTDNLIKATEQIKEIIKPAPEETRTHLNNTYLELTQSSLSNLNDLLEDLEWTKIYLNNLKRLQ